MRVVEDLDCVPPAGELFLDGRVGDAWVCPGCGQGWLCTPVGWEAKTPGGYGKLLLEPTS